MDLTFYLKFFPNISCRKMKVGAQNSLMVHSNTMALPVSVIVNVCSKGRVVLLALIEKTKKSQFVDENDKLERDWAEK